MSLYKIAVILPGRTDEEDVPYDEDAAARIKRDPNELVRILCEKASALPNAVLPDDVGGVDARGKIVHRKKAVKPLSPAYSLAERLFAKNPASYLLAGPGKRDAKYLLFPVLNPSGAAIADFRKIGKLEPKSLDLSCGVRSTAYLTGEAFTEFVCALIKAQTDDGFHVCDGVRLNYGNGYQLEELAEAARRTGYPVRVITGPAPGNEDPRRDRVPVGLILTRSPEKLAEVRRTMRPGFAITTPEALLAEPGYADSLRRAA